jgi:hypothetical protein
MWQMIYIYIYIYDIYLLQLSFHPVAMVGRPVQNEETTQGGKQHTKYTKNRIHKIEKKNTKNKQKY